ncbi:hypothetical protein CCACVL1_13961 [Corchorus capsularis]|uniref:Uncharacterized protein n=1 Tax=Corchorus capsularis TaxID=210143 RepID=A0A1R3I8Z2_COCAP|nr:hypothetical protein CCACVL1_13961 [Corchorus capsularis]
MEPIFSRIPLCLLDYGKNFLNSRSQPGCSHRATPGLAPSTLKTDQSNKVEGHGTELFNTIIAFI